MSGLGFVIASEDELSNALKAEAINGGWLACHFRPARSSKGWSTPIEGHKGFPDWVFVRDGRLVFAELKSGKGRASDEQKRWLEALGEVRSAPEVFLWRPGDYEAAVGVLR